MNPDIERMAKEAGIQWASKRDGVVKFYAASHDQLAKFAALMAEDCAKVCLADVDMDWPNDALSEQATNAAYSIRSKYPMPKGEA